MTLGLISEQTGRHQEAIGLFARALRQARGAGCPGGRAARGIPAGQNPPGAGRPGRRGRTAHEGTHRAQEAGLGLAPYGLDLQYLHYLTHYADGSWDHAQEIADGFVVRVTNNAEARLSAMALFVDVARGRASVEERRAWLEPFFATDLFIEYIGRGLLAEHALWQGDGQAAVAGAEATIRAALAWDEGYGPQVIRAAAVGLSALADRARQARAAGDEDSAAAAVDAARSMYEAAREGAAYEMRPEFVLGIDGRGWLARAEAEWGRANGDNDPGAWQAVVDAFGTGFVYESARSRWRLAEALAEAGDRDGGAAGVAYRGTGRRRARRGPAAGGAG